MISVTEEVRRDVLDQLDDLRRGQPETHKLVYDEIADLVRKADLTKIYDHERL